MGRDRSEREHTPGPWKARDYRADGKAGNAQPGSIWIDCWAWSKSGKTSLGGTVAEVYKNGNNGPSEQEGNARLIAASPDMLKALRLLAAVRPVNWRDDKQDKEAWSALDLALAHFARGAA